ncbi:MAG: aldehyde dehydrogenase family protein [Cytophagales bacterium]|nr:MAG: aldehyde dehydrogenase family protein [Cytophagales bacterium]
MKNTYPLKKALEALSIKDINPAYSTGLRFSKTNKAKSFSVSSPVDDREIAKVNWATEKDFEVVLAQAEKAKYQWQSLPAPHRGDIVRQIGNELRKNKEVLGALVSYECGKILQEGLGEVQEMIDICDFAVGLSRQLNGLTMHSERSFHRMYEQYHPLGIVGVITAFNFPVAVWAWNAMIAAVCGNVCVWKPSEKTPLTAIACQNILQKVLKKNNVQEGVFSYLIGDAKVGAALANDSRVALLSATGSTSMGRKVAQSVAQRLGKSILELGGNNAVIITPSANIQLAIRAVVFGAVGTCGQRCTSTRRLIVHQDIYEQVKKKLILAYQGLPIGNPLQDGILVGPLIDELAVKQFKQALQNVKKEGGRVLVGGQLLSSSETKGSCYVEPAIVEAQNEYATVQEETFAPILYLIKYDGDIMNAIRIQNDVRQGLSSSVFSNDLLETETFLSHFGSDCGIANVNIGTSGAEIGGAFGGEKETGGGREAGSDAWKAYMRRQTNTINYGTKLPLAQGIKFDL